MERVNSSKLAVRIRPREPLPSILICLVTTVVSAEAVGGFSFRLGFQVQCVHPGNDKQEAYSGQWKVLIGQIHHLP
jgi:hypothetical protein